MKRFHVILAAAGLAVALAAGMLAWAQVGPHMGPHRGNGGPEHMAQFVTVQVNGLLDQVKATDAQRTQILAIKDRLLDRAAKLHDGQGAMHDQVLQQWLSDKPDLDQLRGFADRHTADLDAFLHDAVQAFGEVHDILTPAQRAQLADEVRKMHPPRP